jgi:AcrR family transcriptional regulator
MAYARQTSRRGLSRPPRRYRQEARARQTQANGERIVGAAVALVKAAPRISAITLHDIARESGMTLRTILRRFGSRDGVLEAALDALHVELSGQRMQTTPGDVDAAVTSLVGQYERMGDLNVSMLEQEHQFPLLRRRLADGRRFHRAWLLETFAPNLRSVASPEREHRLTALYAATDVYLWKLLRRDLHLDRRKTEATLARLVRGVLSPPVTARTQRRS